MNWAEILGVSPTSSVDEIKTAFRSLAKRLHPDTNKDANAHRDFNRLTEAYEEALQAVQNKAHRSSAPQISDEPPYRHINLYRNIVITVKESITGCKKQIDGISGLCKKCAGSGKRQLDHRIECVTCLGAGGMNKSQGAINLRIVCPTCSGAGKVSWRSCEECAGFGRVDTEPFVVNIPPAVLDGDVFIAEGAAKSAKLRTTGDVHFRIVVRDPKFKIKDDDIHMSIMVPIWTLVLGGVTTVAPPVGDELSLNIPSGSQPNDILKIPRKGLAFKESRGDLVVHLKMKALDHKKDAVKRAMSILKEDVG